MTIADSDQAASTVGTAPRADDARVTLGDEPAGSLRLRRARRIGIKLFVPVTAAVLWVLLTVATKAIDPIFLPPPQEVFGRFGDIGGLLLHGLRISLQMVFLGFAIGGALGVFAGLLFGYSPLARDLLEFTVDALRPIPLFALIPLFILWFGIGMRPQVMLVALGVFLIMSLTTIEAVRNVPRIYVRAGLTLGASGPQIYRTIVIPAIVPTMLVGVRFAIAAAWGLDVAAEYTGSQDGLGYLMIVREQSLDTAGIILIVLIFCALAIVADRVVQIVARRLTRWTEREGETALVRNMLGGI